MKSFNRMSRIYNSLPDCVCLYPGAWVQILPVACHAVESAGLAFTRLTAASQPDCMWDLRSITNHQQTIESSSRRGERRGERWCPYLMSTSSNRTQAPVVNHFLFYDKIYLCTIIICNIILL